MHLKFIFILLFTLPLVANAKIQSKIANAVKTPTPLVIDGQLNDEAWLQAMPVAEFWQTDPHFMKAPSQPTEVRLLYDNRGIYVGARLFDSAPDSILAQLGNRDDMLNADLFSVHFDTYNNGLDAFSFELYASGVQRDSRLTDRTFNAVWQSAVARDAKGWTAEMFIPWSALRFPDNAAQTWRLQLQRNIRRNRETLQWAPEPKGAANKTNYWGQLIGLENIKPPIRLSVSPYFSTSAEHYPHNIPGSSNYSTSISGGADLKYGVSKSFTLDLTLMPDFSTVASDHEIKNLTAFETVYDEKREFFKEGTDLFMKGNLFYTRRIGRRPMNYYKVNNLIGSDATLLRNPIRAQLINASKLSGRTSTNTGIGIFNAMSANTYATYEDSLGRVKQILTEPFTNYNIVAVDKGLNYNSSAYLINTNVTRADGHNNENVTGAGVSYVGKSNKYRVDASGSISQLYKKATSESSSSVDLGYRYNLGLSKIQGSFQYEMQHIFMDKGYNINAMGMNRRNDEMTTSARLSYSIFEPFWKLLRFSAVTRFEHSSRISTGKTTGLTWNARFGTTTRSYLSGWGFTSVDLIERYDYYEPRTTGMFYRMPKSVRGGLHFSTDYRKPIALNGEARLSRKTDNYTELSFELEPVIRFSDQWSLTHTLQWEEADDDKGFVRKIGDTDIIFGNRDLRTLENTLSSRYIIRNNLSLSILVRHYWFRGNYDKFYSLNQEGRLISNLNYLGSHDFNFNTFNIDCVFDWEFAPGSNLSVVYKNSLLKEENHVTNLFIENWDNMMGTPHLNSLTFRILYYIDYQSLIGRLRTCEASKNPVG